MSTNFPASLDTFVDPQGNQSLNNPPHSAQHANANDAIAALQTKVGINSSSDTSSLDYKVAHSVSTSQVGATNGVATLDSNGLVPIAELPVEATFILIPGNFGGSAPNNSIGLNGDYALDVSNFKVYGPRTSGVWPGTAIATLTYT